jgi:hypothetical protein
MGHKGKKKNRSTLSEKLKLATALVAMVAELIKLIVELVKR